MNRIIIREKNLNLVVAGTNLYRYLFYSHFQNRYTHIKNPKKTNHAVIINIRIKSLKKF